MITTDRRMTLGNQRSPSFASAKGHLVLVNVRSVQEGAERNRKRGGQMESNSMDCFKVSCAWGVDRNFDYGIWQDQMLDMNLRFSWPQYRCSSTRPAPGIYVGRLSGFSARSLVAKSRNWIIFIHDAASLKHPLRPKEG